MKAVCIILSILVVLGGVGYIAYDKITDYVVKKTLTMVHEDEALQKEIADAIKSLEGNAADPQAEADASAEPGDSKRPASVPVDEKGRSAAIFPTAPPKATTPPKKVDGALGIDDLEPGDKAYVMQIYNRFSASEVSTVSGMLSGGLTSEEKRKIKAIVYAKVSGAEVSQLYKIAAKYQ